MEWTTSTSPLAYPEAIAAMEKRVDDIVAGRAGEMVWLLEHPPLYTSGTSAKPSDLIDSCFPVYDAGRGGEFTYHGPGQRVAYVMLDLKKRNAMDVRAYVKSLEQWIIATLAEFGVEGFTREGRIGVWVNTSSPACGGGLGGGGFILPPSPNPSRKREGKYSEAKIAALGIRMRKWVTFHGISLNVNPDLAHYAGIVPCGIREYGVTSLKALGVNAGMREIDTALRKNFMEIF